MALTRSQRIGGAMAIATALAAGFEGLRQTVYSDPGPGVATVCYGHTGNVDVAKVYTLAECKALLSSDMLQAVEIVEACWPNRLPVKSLAAFADLTYNVGPRAVCDVTGSKLAAALAMGDIEAACRQLPRWSKARVAGVPVELPGLVKRRAREMALCLEGVSDGQSHGGI